MKQYIFVKIFLDDSLHPHEYVCNTLNYKTKQHKTVFEDHKVAKKRKNPKRI